MDEGVAARMKAMCERELLLGDVATYRARFGGRPMGLGTSEAANRVTILAKRTVSRFTGEYSAWRSV